MPVNDPHQLLSALTKLENLRNSGAPHNARQYRRFVVRGEAELRPMNQSRFDQHSIQITLRDVGRGGVGFVCDTPIERNSTWRICFLSRGLIVGEQAVIVRHSERVLDNIYLVGAQFCIETGLLRLLGVSDSALADADTAGPVQVASFLSPGEVA